MSCFILLLLSACTQKQVYITQNCKQRNECLKMSVNVIFAVNLKIY